MISIIATSCNNSKQLQNAKIDSANLHDSLLTDRDGNKYPIKLLSEGTLWMTTNLNLNIPNSYCYNNAKENCEKYGRLYTWDSAQKVCGQLGEGWRLPRKDELWQLSILYGGSTGDTIAIRKGAYKALLYTGSSGFSAVLGGGRTLDNQYARGDAHGFYWTATETDSLMAWFYNFAKGSQALYLQKDGEKERAFSVRCVKSMSGMK